MTHDEEMQSVTENIKKNLHIFRAFREWKRINYIYSVQRTPGRVLS